MSDSKLLTLNEVGEIEKRDWHLNGALEKRVALSPAERDALCATVRHLMAEVTEFEKTDLVPRSRYNAADAEAREAREMVKTIADRAKTEIERLEAEVARFSKLADERHDQLWDARRQRDDLAAKCAPYLEKLK